MTLGADALAAAARLLRTPHVFIYDAAVPDAARGARHAASACKGAEAWAQSSWFGALIAMSQHNCLCDLGLRPVVVELLVVSALTLLPSRLRRTLILDAAGASGTGSGSMDLRSGAGERSTSDGGRDDGSMDVARRGEPDAAAGGGGRNLVGDGALVSCKEAPGAGAAGLTDALDLLAARAAEPGRVDAGAPLRAWAHNALLPPRLLRPRMDAMHGS